MHLRRLIRWVVGLAGSAFLLVSLARQWDEVSRTLTVPTRDLLLSSVLIVASITANGLAWSRLVENSDRRRIRRAFYLSLPSKYIPGGFAQPISQVTLASGEGVAAGASIVYFVVHSVIIVVASATIGSGVTFLTGVNELLRWSAALMLSLCFLWRPILIALANWITRLISRNRSARLIELIPSQQSLVVAFLWTLGGVAMAGLGFAAIASNTAETGALGMMSAFSLAFLAGFMAIPFPAGVGIREAVLATTLSSVTFPTVIALSAIHRLITMLAELFVMLSTRRIRPHKKSQCDE